MPASSEPGRPFPTAALFTILSVFFTATAAPSITWRDAGELGAAAFQLGIAHPTGFPLALIVSKALALVLPLGDVALRLNIASALAMAGAATLLARFAHDVVRPPGPASLVAAGLVAIGFISSPTLAWFGTSMEAYAWASLLVCTSLVAALHATRTRDPRLAVLAFLVLGLSVGCHATAAIAAAVASAAAISRAPRRGRTLVAGLAAAAAGALVIAYLPARSMAGASVMWDDLSSPGELVAHLSASRIREAYSGRAAGASIGWDALAFLRLLTEDLGAVIFVLAPAGALLAWRRSLAAAVLLGSTALAGALYAVLVNPMGLEDRQTGFLATTACLVLAGIALGEGVVRIALERRATAVALGVAMLVAVPLLRPPSTCRIRHDALASLWAGSALSGLPPRSLVLCTSDEMCGLGLYLGAVEGRRPDVGIVPRQHLWNDGALVRALDRSHPRLAGEALDRGPGVGPRLSALAASRRHVEVFWEVGDGHDLPLAFGPGRAPLDYGPGASPPLARVGPGDPGPDVEYALAGRLVRWLTLIGHDPETMRRCDLSFVARRMLARDFLGVGLVLAWQGKRRKTYASFAHAVMVKPDYAPALVNLAILEAEAGQIDRAIAFARRAVRAEPTRIKARVTLGRLLLLAGHADEGRRILESARPGGSR